MGQRGVIRIKAGLNVNWLPAAAMSRCLYASSDKIQASHKDPVQRLPETPRHVSYKIGHDRNQFVIHLHQAGLQEGRTRSALKYAYQRLNSTLQYYGT